jgi:hypothetical protein
MPDTDERLACMVAALIHEGSFQSEPVGRALRTVQRHVFLPGTRSMPCMEERRSRSSSTSMDHQSAPNTQMFLGIPTHPSDSPSPVLRVSPISATSTSPRPRARSASPGTTPGSRSGRMTVRSARWGCPKRRQNVWAASYCRRFLKKRCTSCTSSMRIGSI